MYSKIQCARVTPPISRGFTTENSSVVFMTVRDGFGGGRGGSRGCGKFYGGWGRGCGVEMWKCTHYSWTNYTYEKC